MKPKLHVRYPDGSKQTFPVAPASVLTLGRDRNVDITLPERKISRQHARILFDGQSGNLMIEDLGSLNGTHVNAGQVHGRMKLQHGDQVRIGSFLILIDLGLEDSDPIVELADSALDGDSQAFERPTNDHETHHESQRETGRQTNTDSRERRNLTDPRHAQITYDYYSYEEEDANRKTDGRMIAGKLEEISLSDVLQMLGTTNKSGELIVSPQKITAARNPEAEAIIYLDSGSVVHVVYGTLRNEEAFYNILKIQKGYFALFGGSKANFDHPMSTPLEALLLEGLRRLDEEIAQFQLKDEDSVAAQPDEPLTGLSSEELRIFQIAWKNKRMKEIWRKSPFGQTETTQIVQRLIRNGFLKRTDA